MPTHPNNNIILFWFRRDLRFHDNHGLYEALEKSTAVLPIFIFDDTILGKLSNKKDKRVSFIHQKITQLQEHFNTLGSSMYILKDDPLNAIKTICEKYKVTEVITNHDYEPKAIHRDLAISNWLQSQNILFTSYKDQVIFEKSEIMKADGNPYTIFTPYSKIWKQHLNAAKLQEFPSENLLHHLYKTQPFHTPTLAEIGFENTASTTSTEFVNTATIQHYHLTRNFPAIHGTSQLSVQLRFGTLSIRSLVKTALSLNETWLNELIWREFFMMILFQFPHVVKDSFKKKYDRIQWRNNEADFKKWCAGETGYAIVDAGMRELNQTGLMHNRVRMVVASFLTKHLLIDWRWGEAYFAEKLLDYELSSNNGNWQWSAGCGCDAAPYFRIFNPAEQTKKFDADLVYIKKWIPNYHPNYLPPIVEHTFARNRALDTYKQALLNEE